jgi:Zinc finger C-x8-C-x5-C-x3-H type (and similar)
MASHLVRTLIADQDEIKLTRFLMVGEHLRHRTRPRELLVLLQSKFRIRFLAGLEGTNVWHRYLKIGACRHGDRCSRKHIKPAFSQTILLPNVYHNPAHDPVCRLTPKELQEGFDAVYEDLYCELAKFGHLLELHVRTIFHSCQPTGDC